MSPTLLLSFDLEDWHQLMGRHLGARSWDRPCPAFERQLRTVFDLLDSLGVRATFFLLGVSMRNYPDLVRELGRRGDEIACHGYAHELVFRQTRDEFRRDVETSVELIERLAGRRPQGYRAPAFSINRDVSWAFEVLADLGFRYDASQYDSPKIPRRFREIPDAPHLMTLPSGRELWEFPLAAVRYARWRLPIGGGSYWRLLGTPVLRRALDRLGRRSRFAPLYFHPYECDPEALRVPNLEGQPARAQLLARYYELRYAVGRGKLLPRVRDALRRFPEMTSNEAVEQLRQSHDASS